MYDNHLREAFYSACKDAKSAEGHYVSLYQSVPFYGGPEEGGWWGSDVNLVAYQQCATEEEAEAIKAEVLKMAEQLNADAKRSYSEQCQYELDFCAARGIDDSNHVFGEVDGETSFSVVLEDAPGDMESVGCRHYE